MECFRRLEEAEWGDIGDPLEGATELTVNGDFVITEGSSELAIANSANLGLGMFKQFAVVSGGGIINMSNTRFVHQVPNLFIFSVSSGDIDDLTARMCINAKRPYDACLKVVDLGKLQRAMFDYGRVRDLDCQVNEIFLPGIIGAVEYESRSRDIRQGPVIDPSPFKKQERFKAQSEERALFVPKDGVRIPKERLIIEIPEPDSHFSEVFRRRDSGDAVDIAPVT